MKIDETEMIRHKGTEEDGLDGEDKIKHKGQRKMD